MPGESSRSVRARRGPRINLELLRLTGLIGLAAYVILVVLPALIILANGALR